MVETKNNNQKNEILTCTITKRKNEDGEYDYIPKFVINTKDPEEYMLISALLKESHKGVERDLHEQALEILGMFDNEEDEDSEEEEIEEED